MIEKEIISKSMKEYIIQEYVAKVLPKACYSRIELKKTPLGEKIIIYTARPGLVVGKKGANIQKIAEITTPNLDPKSVAERILSSFERFGPKRFKSIGYSALQDIMDANATGAEIIISGRGVPAKRSKTWRFYAGHLKKSGDISKNYIKKALVVAELKSGAIGIKVHILTPDVVLPDVIKLKDEEKEIKIEEKDEIKIVKKTEKDGKEKRTKAA